MKTVGIPAIKRMLGTKDNGVTQGILDKAGVKAIHSSRWGRGYMRFYDHAVIKALAEERAANDKAAQAVYLASIKPAPVAAVPPIALDRLDDIQRTIMALQDMVKTNTIAINLLLKEKDKVPS